MTDKPIKRVWNDDGTAYTIELYDDIPIRKQKRAKQRDKQKRLKRQKPDK